ALFYALADTLMPELTAAQVSGRVGRIRSIVGDILIKCFSFSLAVTCVLYTLSGELGTVIYKSADVGHYIRVLSMLMPFMYMDSVTDGMLRGLGEHLYAMKVNIADAVLSLAFVVLLLPEYAVNGYIFILYFSELFNLFLSIKRLRRVSLFQVSLSSIVRPVIAALISVTLTRIIVPPSDETVFNLILHIVLILTSYSFVMLLIPKRKNDRRKAPVRACRLCRHASKQILRFVLRIAPVIGYFTSLK
ncbi:MAG: polysaccharide biosynthesis C-terminal domain-containing protein, partial [Oscillospiraceae bacterium]|nr:polysaccharide biosynthesis C-terminal domain-containing protein [Oscillospiraceae bacterium]